MIIHYHVRAWLRLCCWHFIISLYSVVIPLTAQQFVVDQRVWSAKTDQRMLFLASTFTSHKQMLSGVRFLASVVDCIKAIKCSAYESALYKKYIKLRDMELAEMHIYRIRYVRTTIFYVSLYCKLFPPTKRLAHSNRYTPSRYFGDLRDSCNALQLNNCCV